MSDDEKNELLLLGKRWMSRIKAAEKREQDWMKDAERAEGIYLCDQEQENLPHFNILHSNVETIVPSIYNSTPRPEIRPTHGIVDDPMAKAVSDILERAIATQIDDNKLDAEIEAGAQDAYIAGRDIVRIKFDADVIEQPPMVFIDPETGETYEEDQAPIVTNERVVFENVSFRDFRMGPGKRWGYVPWVGYRHEISEQEKERLENPEYKVKYPHEELDEDQTFTVWEIWDKENRKVIYVIEESERIIDVKDDPLGLADFFPQPEPLQPIKPTGKMTPVCPYTVYKHLAGELDTTTKRINAITKGLKVRGAIAGDTADIEQIAQADDNELIALGNIEGIVAAGGLERAVMWWPIETAISVLSQLYVQREQTKQAIYEVTGISDIIRGQGAASETATAQKIKTQWGSLRIKKMQSGIERQVRDLFVLAAEIIGKHFSAATLTEMTGIQITPEIMQVLKEPLKQYRINVESDSTIRADLTKSRAEMSEFLNGTASFFATMAPIVQQSPQAAGPLAKMYAAFASQFNLGKTAEDALQQFVEMAEQASQQPQDQGPSEMEVKMQEFQSKMELEMQKLQLQTGNLAMDKEIKGVELQIKQAELGLKKDDLDLKEAQAEVDTVMKAAEIEMEQDQERPVAVG